MLERGVLTFFNSRADASSGVGRRDFKYLDSAKVVSGIGGEQAAFIIQYSDGTRHRLAALPDPVHSASVNRQVILKNQKGEREDNVAKCSLSFKLSLRWVGRHVPLTGSHI